MSMDAPQPYRVLARKYRPSTFSTLIGQDALVRTLSNAIDRDRLAHAFLLTGVRGVGKTSTARLLAKALNCVGPDGAGGPTIAPCGVCEPCRAIAESRHLDVIEMDAASRTGVDDVREIIEAVRYAAVSARYKIYIIDEVHMLSKSAFNALLKTLEEPPPHVKFIFATTEVRKLPVTVLSRCQRFDLKRIPVALLAEHFTGILAQEDASAEPEAITLIARAAEGSVRDGLSMLDQALAHGGGHVTAALVREMLGLADRTLVLDLFGAALDGDAAGALARLRGLYDAGADPQAVWNDLLALVHGIMEAKLLQTADDTLPEDERARRLGWANQLSHAQVHRLWQLLLKGLGEIQSAPSALQAAEMALLRVIHAADLPDPGELLKRLTTQDFGETRATVEPLPRRAAEPVAVLAAPAPAVAKLEVRDFRAAVDLCDARHEGLLAKALRDDVNLVRFQPGHIELRLGERAPRDLPTRLARLLEAETGGRWLVSLAQVGGEPTLREQAAATATALRETVLRDPLVEATLQAFPGAELVSVAARAPESVDTIQLQEHRKEGR
ncbi:MAG: DNA polymerase III subunit gamma/tau [Sphingomonadales bacterium]|nr:MAG: DNA polymerase III subunit gamma/tau [Sphingomonadales bacterium]